MTDLERGKLIPVHGPQNTPENDHAIDVQFNPTSLKVTLSNTLKENNRNGNSRASQYVDKSSSSLTVELVFDTTYIEPASGNESQSSQSDSGSGTSTGSQSGGNNNRIEQGSDVRLQTKKIADAFVKPQGRGSRPRPPKRCQFQWGSFKFVGMVDSFEETVDFFSPSGRPLRATVSLKLKEDRYQFNTEATAAQDQTPELHFTGNGAKKDEKGGGSGSGNGNNGASQTANPVPGSSKDGPGSWRDNAMFNGVESPRLPSASALALPSVSLSAGAGFGISGGAGIGLSAGIGISGGFSASVSASVNVSVGANVSTGTKASSGSTSPSTASAKLSSTGSTGPTPAPAFKYGNSSAVGTGVPGAFSAKNDGSLKASSLQTGSLQLRAEATTASSSGTEVAVQSTPARTTSSQRSKHGISVAALVKNAPDNGVGFD